jgi:hypothetical protein
VPSLLSSLLHELALLVSLVSSLLSLCDYHMPGTLGSVLYPHIQDKRVPVLYPSPGYHMDGRLWVSAHMFSPQHGLLSLLLWFTQQYHSVYFLCNTFQKSRFSCLFPFFPIECKIHQVKDLACVQSLCPQDLGQYLAYSRHSIIIH